MASRSPIPATEYSTNLAVLYDVLRCATSDDLHHDRAAQPVSRLRPYAFAFYTVHGHVIQHCHKRRLPQQRFTIMATYLRRPRLMKVIRHSSSSVWLKHTTRPGQSSAFTAGAWEQPPLSRARGMTCVVDVSIIACFGASGFYPLVMTTPIPHAHLAFSPSHVALAYRMNHSMAWHTA